MAERAPQESRAANMVLSDLTSTQLPATLLGTVRPELPSKQSVGQRVLEQLLIPRSLLMDVEVQKLFDQGFAFLQQENWDEANRVFRKAVNLAHHNLYQPHAKPELEGKIAAIAHNDMIQASGR